MVEIPILGKVECSDGPCGTATQVVIDFEAQAATHLVVTLDDLQAIDCKVPVGLVAGTTPERIRLGCTRHELLQHFAANDRKGRRAGQALQRAGEAGRQPLPAGQVLTGARRAAA